jgi:putative membrane protein
VGQAPKIDRQREHQANERTFLAWLRTSIALITFGFAIARFGIFLRQIDASLSQSPVVVQRPFLNTETLGLSLVILGVTVILGAAWQYNRVFWQIERGNYQPDRMMVFIMTVAVVLLGLLTIPVVLWRNIAPRPAQPSQSLKTKLPAIAQTLTHLYRSP